MSRKLRHAVAAWIVSVFVSALAGFLIGYAVALGAKPPAHAWQAGTLIGAAVGVMVGLIAAGAAADFTEDA